MPQESTAKPATGDASIAIKSEAGLPGSGPFDWLRQEVDHLFEEFHHHQRRSLFDWPGLSMNRLPNVDLDDKGKEFCLTAELPGFEAQDVTLEIRDGSLRIAAMREERKEERRENMLLCERQSGMIERAVPLPQAIDPASAQASLKDGVLTVTLPKQPATQPAVQRIPVRT
ncbi:Hsp20/alpha crystallin family protein [Novosphingobium sp.]|uniref:Hsp20/alpha crystallin family protein n=1 Tax=Novosphingobium sp. TaxID=1874826 RepID=UPI0025DD445D|nr:Hsp20/alpha crystallin family protein [Novosphingobium sp.]